MTQTTPTESQMPVIPKRAPSPVRDLLLTLANATVSLGEWNRLRKRTTPDEGPVPLADDHPRALPQRFPEPQSEVLDVGLLWNRGATITTNDNYPSHRLKSLMMCCGGLIIFGPQHLEATMALVNDRNEKAVFSGAKIDDLEIPDALMIDCSLIFCHPLTWSKGRGVTSAELQKWSAQLLEGIVFKPVSVPGLTPEEIEEPAKRFTADEKTSNLLFLVQWGPVPSKHCVEVARSLERAYARSALG